MPIAVDVEHRLREIAEATLDIVAARGADAVTIREVASRVGGSTTLVTNYLPTRAALLLNAIEHAFGDWRRELDEVIDSTPDEHRLAAVCRWSCSTSGHDQQLRKLLVEMLARSGSSSAPSAVIRSDARSHHEVLLSAATAAGSPDPALAANALHLALRGFYLSTLEDPEQWTSKRVTPVIHRLVALLTAG